MNYTEDFELFWRAYPPRWNEDRGIWRRADKIGAFAEWVKLTVEEKCKAFNTVQREKASKWTPDARKWLKHKPWEDVIAPLREFDRPPPTEIKGMIDKMLAGKIVQPGWVGQKRFNTRRNEARRKLGL